MGMDEDDIPKSVMVAPTVFTQLWYCAEECIPTKLKNTRRLDYESAHETWNELLSNDWELIEHQINDAAAQLLHQYFLLTTVQKGFLAFAT